ncbi:hypothetical protein OG921_23395 [Aldersonia sp. NBC_00410]|uniref:hypothetical protein n=1 Tax=Aldersonia sp. NBC_00410 TaxID=2975954 RepID=UPI0022574369|nr:hypothetical protein [Aldersonia sp. NBC_00410]MCX5046120.1 hypothetical protein [Aldersonia sp. NBC_00410]
MDPEPERLLHRRQALARGYTPGELERARQSGVLQLVRRGVYARTALVDAMDVESQHRLLIEATVATSDAQAVVSHASAAVLHGIAVWNLPLHRVHLTLDASSGGRIVRRRHVHTAPLAADDVVRTTDGIAVTSVARTIIDIARTAPFETAVVTADSALQRELVTNDELCVAIVLGAARRGIPRARRVVAFADGRSESVGESRSRVLMHTHGLPKPDLQRVIRAHTGRRLGRVDFYVEQHHTVGEFDGMGKYTRYLRPGETSADAVRREKLREDALRATGAAVARWTWPELDHPSVVVQRLRSAFTLGSR